MNGKHILITGGAGYIGSLLTGKLLYNGYIVTVVDKLLFGGESLLAYFQHPNFHFVLGDVCSPETFQAQSSSLKIGNLKPVPYDTIIHLAAIVGFPACQAVGKEVAFAYNTESTMRMFDIAERSGVKRFIFASTYSNYGLSQDGQPVTEESPLRPQSLYAETKIAAEQFLLREASAARCAPIVYRFATLFGVSPRTRFDLIINQFVLEALLKRRLIIYQRGYARSFIHVSDIGDVIQLAIETPLEKIRGQVFNVGSDEGNYTKDEIVKMIQKHIPGTTIEYKDLTFGGDMRDIRVSFAKIRQELGYVPKISVENGICEIRDAINNGLIKDPLNNRYRNAQFIVQ
jgi:nucleoside-diphosphate-sugar epimerase